MSVKSLNYQVLMKTVMKILFIVIFCITCFVGSRNIDVNFPIIYSKPFQSERNTYFGYSVVLHQEWVQIGAPRANYSTIELPEVLEPGVVYRCPIFKKCEEVILDKSGNEEDDLNRLQVWDNKNNSWTGVAMDLEPGENGRFVVCGHLWKNQVGYQKSLNDIPSRGKQPENILGYYVVGKCYWNYANKPITEPAVNLWPHYKFAQEKQYHFSQVGMSIHMFSKKDGGVLLGAPGMLPYNSNRGRGGVMNFRLSVEDEPPSVRKRSIRPHSCRRQLNASRAFATSSCSDDFQIKNYDLWGYQVSLGHFFGEECHYVASAPRGDNLKGYVLIYNVQEPGSETYYSDNISEDPARLKCFIRQREGGEVYGEYFGSSLAVADITGDGFDEMIVGSPLFSTKTLGDEGCIHVFNYHNAKVKRQTICGNITSGRFGTSLMSLGDLDKDGYEDIAVGVPHEGSGVVYIYNGSPEGLNTFPNQRIAASDLYPSLRGFGISISRPQDIDGNSYADIAIGSYLSEHTVLLRTHPVIDLSASVTSPTRITDEDTRVALEIHSEVKYDGRDVLDSLEMNRTLVIKSMRPKEILANVSQNVYLQRGKVGYFRTEIDIQLQEDKKYLEVEVQLFISPLLLTNHNLKSVIRVNNDSTKAGTDNFCKKCHLQRAPTNSIFRIPITRSCSADGCRPDLQLSCYILNDNKTTVNQSFIIGSSRVIQIVIDIVNFGDIADIVITSVGLPKEVKIAQIPPYCSATTSNVTCRFDKILRNRTKNINIHVEVSDSDRLLELSETDEPLVFNVSSFSQSFNDTNKDDNYCTLKQYLTADMDVEIQSSALFQACDPVPVGRSTKETKVLPVKFSHIFKVHKTGVTPTSPARRAIATFFVPYQWRGSKKSETFTSVSYSADDDKVFCSQGNTTDKILAKKIVEYSTTCNLPPSNKTFYVNCTNENVECKVFLCELSILNENMHPRITFDIIMDTSVLEPEMERNDRIVFSSHGFVEIVNITNLLSPPRLRHEVIEFTVFASSDMEEAVQTWIIIVCIVAGILLLSLIIFGLAKAGFFKRKLKEDMQEALKNNEDTADS